jgi:hypothetical protein
MRVSVGHSLSAARVCKRIQKIPAHRSSQTPDSQEWLSYKSTDSVREILVRSAGHLRRVRQGVAI